VTRRSTDKRLCCGRQRHVSATPCREKWRTKRASFVFERVFGRWCSSCNPF